jgi:hypothetical protein
MPVVHFQDWPMFFSPQEAHALAQFAAHYIQLDRVGKLQILNVADFQAVRGWDGLRVLDFEPNLWLRTVMQP